MVQSERRRRRLRRDQPTGPPGDDMFEPDDRIGAGPPESDDRTAATTGVTDPDAGSDRPAPRRSWSGQPPSDHQNGERGLRNLVGPGSSQVSISAALRARDAARPNENDLAAAEQELTVVRRNWVPREDFPRSR